MFNPQLRLNNQGISGYNPASLELRFRHRDMAGGCAQTSIKSVNLLRTSRRFAPLALLLLATCPGQLGGTERHLAGREIFLQQCAKCHGRSGEGVKGKHDEPLRGDRPLDKLTRYIERAMPDDNPGKCVGEDATAVARYIYDAFYSREAQARKNPARVELVRLTNRQYLTTIADLIKHFTGIDNPLPAAERGLRASYYNSSHFNAEKKAFDRVDRQVDFDFGDGSPDKEHGTNEFAIEWRGSLIAEETGDYEFILKTPNGVRLWVNDDDEPLIDAWVASGQLSEHKAALRLLGGRAYPLRLNYFKFKDKSASISLQWKPPHGTQQPLPARNLSPGHTTPTLVLTTPFPPDDSSVGYERGVAVSKAWDEATTQAAIEVANHIVRKLDTLSHSKPAEAQRQITKLTDTTSGTPAASGADLAKNNAGTSRRRRAVESTVADTNRVVRVQAFCAEFAATALRRLLTEEQKRVFILNQFKKAAKLEDVVKRVVLLTLKSPRFLYLGLESGAGGRSPRVPDAFEVAERLSFGLWDSLADEELSKAAAQGSLHTPEQVDQQARRMLADPRAHAKMQAFLHHWLQMDRVEPLSKDDKLFPGFSPEIIADLRTSLNLFLEDAVWNGSSDYCTLLLADYLFVNNRLAQFYGISTNLTDDFTKVSLEAEPRSGVLTHPYLLSAFSYPKLTSPIHRGVFLTRNIVGRALRPPPMAMTFKDADFAPNLTMREKVAQMTRPQACQACHSVINPLGFSLESYDAVGRFRTQDNDRPIDPVSDYLTDEGENVRLAGARDVAQFALTSDHAQNGFIEQLFHHVVKQPVRAYGADVMDRLRQSFVASEFNIQKLLVDIVTVSALHGVERPIVEKPIITVAAPAKAAAVK